jgi:hypothetical protein
MDMNLYYTQPAECPLDPDLEKLMNTVKTSDAQLVVLAVQQVRQGYEIIKLLQSLEFMINAR